MRCHGCATDLLRPFRMVKLFAERKKLLLQAFAIGIDKIPFFAQNPTRAATEPFVGLMVNVGKVFVFFKGWRIRAAA